MIWGAWTISNYVRSLNQGEYDTRCLILTGEGRAFCSGADVGNLAKRRFNEGDEPPWRPYHGEIRAPRAMRDCDVPVIGALNGHAVGGGLGLAIVCDLRVANKDARYGANFVRLGLHPGMASTYLLPRLLGVPKGIEMLLTGRIVSGAEAAEIGLANYAVDADAVLPKALELAREIASAAPIAVRWAKRSIYRNLGWDPRAAAELEAHAQSRTLETEDSQEGIRALLEKREPRFKGR